MRPRRGKIILKDCTKLCEHSWGGRTMDPPQVLVVEGKRITSPKELANEQIKYFSSKIEKIMQNIPRPTEDPLRVLSKALENWEAADNRVTFEFRKVTAEETLAAMKLLGKQLSI